MIMLWLLVAFSVSVLSISVYIPLARYLGVIDRPNERSAHDKPTVVGAGVGVILGVSVAIIGLDSMEVVVWHLPWMLVAVLAVLSAVGLIDDRYNLSSRLRLMVYFLAAGSVVLLEFSGLFMPVLSVQSLAFSDLFFSGSPLSALSILWAGLMIIALVWTINLYNFMDGLDGFAISQCLAVCVALGLFAIFGRSPHTALAWQCFILASAALGLFIFNWPPARVFMGDAGAVPIGFLLGLLGLTACQADLALGAAWLILMMPFLVDATFTLVIRGLAGYRPHIAHSDHAYQRLARRTGSALSINLGLLMLHAIWQFPLAMLAIYSPNWMSFSVIFSAIPTVLLLVRLQRST